MGPRPPLTITASARCAASWKAAAGFRDRRRPSCPNAPTARRPPASGHVAEVGVDDLAGQDLVSGADDLDAHGVPCGPGRPLSCGQTDSCVQIAALALDVAAGARSRSLHPRTDLLSTKSLSFCPKLIEFALPARHRLQSCPVSLRWGLVVSTQAIQSHLDSRRARTRTQYRAAACREILIMHRVMRQHAASD